VVEDWLTDDEGAGFVEGQISFRIHSASSKVEPSLKFDINLVGLPLLTSHFIEYKFKPFVR
jgi:hypothetical protein